MLFRSHHQEMCHHCHCENGLLRSALIHTAQIYLFLFLVSFGLGLAIHYIGLENLSSILMSDSFLQPVLAALIGLIPNCAASVLITELYLSGTLSFGAAVAGLCTGAGMGLLMLFRIHHRWKQNLLILGLLMLFGIAAGEIVYFLNYLL